MSIPRRIITRHSTDSGDVPLSLLKGELAVNITDRSIFIGDENGNAVQIINGSGSGVNGMSAYQIAVQLGYVGTVNNWITSLHGASGLDGKSAYQSALDAGFIGTPNAWIASLHGANGTNGTNGTNGLTGKSAYEIAIDNGFIGTEPQWLASLVGDSGPVGKSAYELAVNQGFVGNIDEWLDSLKGDDGQGGSGSGIDGKSAYEVALVNGFIGSESDWLLSLKGPKGDDGTGNGTPFTVIDWNPITIGEPEPITYLPNGIGTLYTPTTFGSTNDGNSPIIIADSFDLPYEALRANVNNNMAGSLTFSNMLPVTCIRYVIFSTRMLTNSDISDTINGTIEDGIVISNIMFYNPIDFEPDQNIISAVVSSPASGNVQFTNTENSSEIIFAFAPDIGGNRITLENQTYAVLDLDDSPYMTILSTASYLNAATSVIPNDIATIGFVSTLATSFAGDSLIPINANDGDVLKIVGNKGTLLNQSVRIGDECTLYNNKTEFLLDRSFEENFGDVHQVSNYTNNTDPIVLDKATSFVVKNRTIFETSARANDFLISKNVINGKIVYHNRCRDSEAVWFYSTAPYSYINELNNVLGGDSSTLNASSLNPAYPHSGLYNNCLGFSTTVFDINFSETGGIIRKLYSVCSESKEDLKVDQMTIVENIDNDNDIDPTEQNKDMGPLSYPYLRIRVPLVGKKLGYYIRFHSSNGQNTFSTSLNGTNITYQFGYPITVEDIAAGFKIFYLRFATSMSVTQNITIAATFGIPFNQNISTMFWGTSSFITHSWIAPNIINGFSMVYDGQESMVLVQDSDVIMSDVYAKGKISATYSGTLRCDFPQYIEGYAQAGDLIRIDSKVSASGGNENIVWDVLLVQPTINDIVDGYYTITQLDIENGYVDLTFNASNLYPQQFIKFYGSVYHSGDDFPSTDVFNELVYVSGVEDVQPQGFDMYLNGNLDIDTVSNYPYPSVQMETVTTRPYYELYSGEITSALRISSNTVGSKVVVVAQVSDNPNSGWGTTSISLPIIDESLSDYVITEQDVNELGGNVEIDFPITFSPPPTSTQPYFVRLTNYVIDGTTGARLSANGYTYCIIQPLIDAPEITGQTTVVNYPPQGDLTYGLPSQLAIGDRFYFFDDSFTYNYIPSPVGFPYSTEPLLLVNMVPTESVISYDYNGGTQYVERMFCRVLRDNPTGIPVKGRVGSIEVTVNP